MFDVSSFSSSASLKPVPFLPIVMLEIFAQFRQCAFHCPNKVLATRRRAAEADHRFALGVIVRDGQHLAVRPKPVRRALNQVVRGLAAARVQHFHRRGRYSSRCADWRPSAVEKDGNRVPMASWYSVSRWISSSRAAAEWRGLPGASSGQLCSRL